jgi:hypothetical protein
VHNLARIFLRNKLQARVINDSFKHPARVLQTMQSGSIDANCQNTDKEGVPSSSGIDIIDGETESDEYECGS